MAGAMRKMAVYLGLVEDERFEEYDEIDDYDEPEERAPRSGSTAHGYARPATSLRDRRDATSAMTSGAGAGWDHGTTRGSLATVPDRSVSPAAAAMAGGLDRITTIHPRTYNEAKQIGEAFRSGTPVIMNLSDMDDSDAKRLVDFSAGLVFGLRGSIERVTNKVFLLSPVNVSVTAEDKARMAESSFFNQS